MKLETQKTLPKSSAAGQYLGYSLQPVRLCYHLLRTPIGSKVSLEYLDDIAIHYPDGRILLEQNKSSLAGNPVADKSIDLWKSFGNWATLCKDGKIQADKAEFRMFVTPCHAGDLVKDLELARSKEAASEILTKLKKWITVKNASVGCNPISQSS